MFWGQLAVLCGALDAGTTMSHIWAYFLPFTRKGEYEGKFNKKTTLDFL